MGIFCEARNHTILGVITAAPALRRWAEQSNLEVVAPSSDYASILCTTSFDYRFDDPLERLGGRLLGLVRRDIVAARHRVIDLMHRNLVAVDFRSDLTGGSLDISLAARRQGDIRAK